MSAREPQAGAGTPLAMVALLHMFLVQNPELTALPADWSFNARDGISVAFRAHPEMEGSVRAVADALGLEVTQYDSGPRDGVVWRFFSALGTFSGHKAFVHGTTKLPAEDGAA